MSEVLLITGATCIGDLAGYYVDSFSANYRSDKPIIYICRGYENDDFVLQHEYGHHVYRKLPSRVREYWSFLHSASGMNDHVRDYGNRNEEEDFCDTFAHIRTGGIQWSDNSKILKKKFIFIEKLLQYLKLT